MTAACCCAFYFFLHLSERISLNKDAEAPNNTELRTDQKPEH